MTAPILNRILANVSHTVSGIAPNGSYNFPLLASERVQVPAALQNGLAMLDLGDPQRMAEVSYPKIGWRQPIYISCFYLPDETSTLKINRVLTAMRSDVEKAMLKDYTRGGIARNTIVGDPVYHISAEGYAFVAVRIDVEYYTAWNDPTVQAA